MRGRATLAIVVSSDDMIDLGSLRSGAAQRDTATAEVGPVAAASLGSCECVSTVTLALSPACNRNPASTWVSWRRTGTRWTTFTQLPVAFSGGRMENCEPVLGLTLVTSAENRLPGYRSISTIADWPGRMRAS